jgi:hypothetical protein
MTFHGNVKLDNISQLITKYLNLHKEPYVLWSKIFLKFNYRNPKSDEACKAQNNSHFIYNINITNISCNYLGFLNTSELLNHQIINVACPDIILNKWILSIDEPIELKLTKHPFRE